MKISRSLLWCRIIACFLALSTVICFYVSLIDTSSVDDLTEEEQAACMAENSFRYAVRALDKLEMFDNNISFEDIIYIKYMGLRVKTLKGYDIKRIVCLGTSQTGNDLYLDFSGSCQKTSQEEYDDLYREYHAQGETVYTLAKLKLAKETALSDELDTLLKQWRKEELGCYQTVKKTIVTSNILYKKIIAISTLAVPADKTINYVVKIILQGTGETLYFVTYRLYGRDMMPTDKSVYSYYLNVGNSTETVYTDFDIQMIKEDLGGN